MNPVLPTHSLSQKINIVGGNTGNIVFDTSLKTIFGNTISFSDDLSEKMKLYDALVIHNVIWITEKTTLSDVKGILDKIGSKPVIPISVGIQTGLNAKEFNFDPNCINVQKELQERAVLGVRGYRTAEFLNSVGIKNIRVIGCPSMYYQFSYNLSIEKKNLLTNQLLLRIIIRFGIN